ncbi:MAG: GtrA family protein [Clostridia bacterium]
MTSIRAFIHKLLQKPLIAKLWQFAKFGLVGVSNTLISLGVYQLCVQVFHIHYLLANVLGFVVSVSNAYFWNSRYVFSDGQKKTVKQHLTAFARSFTAYGGTFLLDCALLVFWVEICHVSKTLAPILNLMITVPLNFLVNKLWAFKERQGKGE